MKTDAHLSRRTVRSRPLAPNELPSLIDRWVQARKRPKQEVYAVKVPIDTKGKTAQEIWEAVWAPEYGGGAYLQSGRLIAIDAFVITCKIGVYHHFASRHADLTRICEFLRTLARDTASAGIIWSGVMPGASFDGPDPTELDMNVSWSSNAYPDRGMYRCGIEFGIGPPSRFRADQRAARDLFNLIFDTLGMRPPAQAKLVGNDLVLDLGGLLPPESTCFANRVNPTAARIAESNSFDDVWNAAQAVQERVHREYGLVFERPWFNSHLTGPQYERVRSELDGAVESWELTVDGYLKKPWPEMVVEATRDSAAPQRVPICQWREQEIPGHEFEEECFQFDFVNTPDRPCLELHGNYCDEQTILSRANVVPGLDFHLVER